MAEPNETDPLSPDSWLARRLDAWLSDLVTSFGQGRLDAEAGICAAAIAHAGRRLAGLELTGDGRREALQQVTAARDLLAAVVQQAQDEAAAAAWLADD